MSLPSNGFFVKDGVVVGIGNCNVGWYVDGVGLFRCMNEAWSNARARQQMDQPDPSSSFAFNYYMRSKEWVGSKEDLLTFDYMMAYELKFPRELFKLAFDGKLNGHQLDEMYQNNLIDPQDRDEWTQIVFNTKGLNR